MAQKWTLLKMTQSILESMDSDNVNSINDTDEALRVANIIMEEYYSLLRLRDWPFSKVTAQLIGLGNTSQPTKMQLPDNIYHIETLKYNQRLATDNVDKWNDITYLSPTDFLANSFRLSTSASDVVSTTTDSGTPLLIRNDYMPTYYTSFDDTYIYMDAYVATLESSLQQSKTVIFGMQEPTWLMQDSFVPNMPARYFTLLLETARRVASKRLRQLEDAEAEIKSRDHYNRLKVAGNRTDGGIKFYNWGYSNTIYNRGFNR